MLVFAFVLIHISVSAVHQRLLFHIHVPVIITDHLAPPAQATDATHFSSSMSHGASRRHNPWGTPPSPSPERPPKRQRSPWESPSSSPSHQPPPRNLRGFRSISEDSNEYPNPDDYDDRAEWSTRTSISWYVLGLSKIPPFRFAGDSDTCCVCRTVWEYIADDRCKGRSIVTNRATLASQWWELHRLHSIHLWDTTFREIEELEEQRELRDEASRRESELAENLDIVRTPSETWSVESWMVPSS